MPQIHCEGAGRLTAHMTRISRKSTVAQRQVINQLERLGRETGLGVFWWLGGRAV